MKKIRFIKKIPADIIGVGHFEPQEGGREYSLPDVVVDGLIATKDEDWEEVKEDQNNSHENASSRRGRGSK
jgi:hypothetical protein